MEERQIQKIWRRVILLTREPEIAELAKQHFGSLPPTPVEPVPTLKEDSAWKEVGAHWIIATLAGVGVTWDGSYAVVVRCLCLLGLLVWLSIDVWKILWKTIIGQKNALLKVIGLQLGLIILVAVAVNSIVAHERQKRDEEIDAKQRDVARNLLIQEDHQDDPDDPFSAAFSLVNNSDARILTNRVTCIVNTITHSNNVNGHNLVFSGPSKEEIFNTPLEPNGSAETFRCPYSILYNVTTGSITCADIIYHVEYTDDVPWTKTFPYKPKERRYFALRGEDGIRWHEEQVALTKSPCER